VWVDGWAAVHEGRSLLHEEGTEWTAAGEAVPEGMEGEESQSDDDDDVAEIGAETEWLREQKEAEGGDRASKGRGKTYGVDDGNGGENTVVMTAIEHYRLRGVALERFNYQEYESCVTIVKKSKAQREDFVTRIEDEESAIMEEQRRRGRRENSFVCRIS
jgi:hypothetical protein